MKITKEYLKQIISEELEKMQEADTQMQYATKEPTPSLEPVVKLAEEALKYLRVGNTASMMRRATENEFLSILKKIDLAVKQQNIKVPSGWIGFYANFASMKNAFNAEGAHYDEETFKTFSKLYNKLMDLKAINRIT